MKVWRCSLMCLFVGMLLLSCAGAPQAVPPEGQVVETPAPACQGAAVENIYLNVHVNYAEAQVAVKELVFLFNDGEVEIPSVVMHLPPEKYGFSLDEVVVSTPADLNLEGNPANYKVDGIVLEIFEPIPAGSHIFIDLKFAVDVPSYSKGLPRTSAISEAIILGNWFPTVAVCEADGWDRHQWHDIGDPFYTECTSFTVLVSTDEEGLKVASTGEAYFYGETSWMFMAKDVRDFALAIGPFQTKTAEVEGTEVTVYTLDEAFADFTLEAVSKEISEMNAEVGPYAYDSLDVVVVPTPSDRDAWGMEYPEVIMLYGFEDLKRLNAMDWAEIIARHETAHEWFYAAIGNDEIREPWLDEAFAVFFTEPIVRSARPGIDRPVSDFTDWEEYSDVVYRGAAAFLAELKDCMGEDAFYAGIQEYYAAYKFGIAHGEDFFAVMQRHTDKDLKPLIRKYFAKAYLK